MSKVRYEHSWGCYGISLVLSCAGIDVHLAGVGGNVHKREDLTAWISNQPLPGALRLAKVRSATAVSFLALQPILFTVILNVLRFLMKIQENCVFLLFH